MRKLPTFDQWEVVRIEWMDACGGEDGWEDIEGHPGVSLHRITTVGQVHSQTDEDITLCLSWDNTSRLLAGWVTVPASGITHYERFR